MHKPSNYDSVSAKTGTFQKVTPGPYILGICKAEETQSRAGDPMLVLSIDIADGPNKSNYRELSKRLNKDCLLKHYRLLTDNAADYLKGDIQAIEKSNPGFSFMFDERALPGKFVGGMLAEEEYYSDGDIKTILKIRYLCSVDDVHSGKLITPPLKKLDTSFPPEDKPIAEDDLPF
jgi:hypothetical protein